MASITYILRKEDLLEFNEYHAKMNSAYGKSKTRHQLLWPIIVAVLALFITISSNNVQLSLLLLIGAFIWSILVPALLKKRFQQHISEQLSDEDVANAVGDCTLEVTENGLLEKKSAGETLLKWSDVVRLEQSKHHVYLYMSEDAAIIIPKEMISEDSDYSTFYKELLEALEDENNQET
jgi:hypothetical protein